MRDPWKYLAFPMAGITGYLVSIGVQSFSLGSRLGIPEIAANVLVIGLAGFLSGFLIDDLIPAYLDKVRGGSATADMGDTDIGGDSGGDFDFD